MGGQNIDRVERTDGEWEADQTNDALVGLCGLHNLFGDGGGESSFVAGAGAGTNIGNQQADLRTMRQQALCVELLLREVCTLQIIVSDADIGAGEHGSDNDCFIGLMIGEDARIGQVNMRLSIAGVDVDGLLEELFCCSKIAHPELSSSLLFECSIRALGVEDNAAIAEADPFMIWCLLYTDVWWCGGDMAT